MDRTEKNHVLWLKSYTSIRASLSINLCQGICTLGNSKLCLRKFVLVEFHVDY